ncbi:MAG: lipoyl synthase [Elusimicrobia bacterium]|nr:lipoyl synthase [Elusimicrobiota bacterium]
MRQVGGQVKFPQWIIDEVRKNKKDLRHLNSLNTIQDTKRFNLHTVCDEALCPNKGKCFSEGEATFLILGDICTRKCKFCAVNKKEKPLALDSEEPRNIAILSKKWNLKYIVFTSPTRDDLNDGGAAHFAKTITVIKKISTAIKTEPLIPDFGGNIKSLETVLNAKPNVLAHNIETVPSLYEKIRLGSDYKRSLQVIKNSKKLSSSILTKSGLMLGLGETEKELRKTFSDLLEHNCELLTLGQYIPPSKNHYPVKRYLHPEEFKTLKEKAEKMGFKAVLSGPLVRSSYKANYLYEKGIGAMVSDISIRENNE